MKFETKPLTLAQRAECNDLVRMEFDAKTGNVVTTKTFSVNLCYLRYGLKSINGVEVTKDNFDAEVAKLKTDEIFEIGNYISEETNFPNGKKSRSGS